MGKTLDRERLERFSRCWDDLIKVFPAARAAAVAEMGRAAKEDLDANVIDTGVDDLFGHIRNAQRIYLGSGGGYAAVRPETGPMTDRYGRTKTWRDKTASTRQVTKWLDRGHGVRRPAAESGMSRKASAALSAMRGGSGKSYVSAHLFYSLTKAKALDHALKAADRALGRIADEIDY